MRQRNIDEAAQQRRCKDALTSTIISTLILFCSSLGMTLLSLLLLRGSFGGTLLLILALLDLGMIIPVWILYKKRLEEIEGGEEDAAAEY